MKSLQSVRLVALTVLAGVCIAGVAGAAERLVVAPVNTTGDIPPAIGQSFTIHLRALTKDRAELVDRATAGAALTTAGATAACADDACAAGIATAAGARFVLTGTVDNTDEIYTVDLRLYDALTKSAKSAQGVCELCAANEVNRTISAAFTQIQPALAAPATGPLRVAIEVITIPPGARITLAGKAAGQSPIVVRVEPGEHRIGAIMDGMQPVERTVIARKETIKLALKMQAAPAVAAVTPTPSPTVVAPPVTPAPIATPAAGDSSDGESDSGYLYTGGGMLIGGALLTGAGIFAIIKDGDVTCTDGLGPRECPTVFNTKGVGIAGLGLGAALIGAGATLIIVDVLDDADMAPSAVITPGGAMMGFGGRF